MERVDVAVIGAGVVGLAVARALAQRGREVLILEAAERFGSGVSSRNSEVIHAGIYYPRGSLKARLCVAGRELLYAFCLEHGVAHRRCGKLIVASNESQLAELVRIRAAALGNGVELASLARPEALALEPGLRCAAALHSPLTGIIDAHAYMLALLGQAERLGAVLACDSAVNGLALQADGFRIAVNGAPASLHARALVNSAGLSAAQLARLTEGFPPERVPTAYLAKGSYFTLAGRAPFGRLIYPLPEPGGLGVHLTLDLAGRARFGPDVEWVSELDYAVDVKRAAAFYGAIRAWWPALPDGALEPAYAGIRPKITGPGEPAADFRIDGPAVHGVAGLVQLFGIESPGLTASLAIAEHVAALIS
ncbi:MAG TPA: NAD(P)/FAD-dependent oxidoreductase [Steroidobacteraceae bacterium]|nr:NAD(P)/FAD-dependent oxidoreductase [Steroidobacteraceae bacterium]